MQCKATSLKTAQARYVNAVIHSLDFFQQAHKGKHHVLSLAARLPDGTEKSWTMLQVAKKLEMASKFTHESRRTGSLKVDLAHDWTRFARIDPEFGNFICGASAVGGEIVATCLFRVDTKIGQRTPPYYQQGNVYYTMHYALDESTKKPGNHHSSTAMGRHAKTRKKPPAATTGPTGSEGVAGEDMVRNGLPEEMVCGGIPWRSALSSIFYTEDEVRKPIANIAIPIFSLFIFFPFFEDLFVTCVRRFLFFF